MRLACLFGRHEWVKSPPIAPPPEWNDAPQPEWIEMEDWRGRTVQTKWQGFPTFVLKHCRRCPATDYDMEFPDA